MGLLAWLPKGGGRKSTTSEEVDPEVSHLMALGRRPKAIPPGFGRSTSSGTRIHTTLSTVNNPSTVYQTFLHLLGAGPLATSVSPATGS